mgnify:CR=1 FL=1
MALKSAKNSRISDYQIYDIHIGRIITKDMQMQSDMVKAVENNECEYANAIIMEPSTGNILSMASYPNFNLNTPFEPNTEDAKKNLIKDLKEKEWGFIEDSVWVHFKFDSNDAVELISIYHGP